MPTLTISTNVSIQDSNQLADTASKLIASMLGKPELYVMVQINAEQILYFGGNNNPAALLSLQSLGLPETEIKSYSERLCDFINSQLGIAADRVYINFESPARSHWGWNNTTFG